MNGFFWLPWLLSTFSISFCVKMFCTHLLNISLIGEGGRKIEVLRSALCLVGFSLVDEENMAELSVNREK